MDRCDKCRGFLYTSEGAVKCINCGKRFYKKDEFVDIRRVKCERCGKEFTTPSKTRRVCHKCKSSNKAKFRHKLECQRCGKEFYSKTKKAKFCSYCRIYSSSTYRKKKHILVTNLLKIKEGKNNEGLQELL